MPLNYEGWKLLHAKGRWKFYAILLSLIILIISLNDFIAKWMINKVRKLETSIILHVKLW